MLYHIKLRLQNIIHFNLTLHSTSVHQDGRQRRNIFVSPDLDGKRFVANTECDRNEFLLLPIPIETDWLKLFPIPGFGRRALNFQIEILGNQVDLGQPLGLRYKNIIQLL